MSEAHFQSHLHEAQGLLASGAFAAALAAYEALLHALPAQTADVNPAHAEQNSPQPGPQNASVRILVLDGMGRCLHALGRSEEAEQAFGQSLALLEKIFGPQHAHIAPALLNLSRLLAGRNAFREAVPLAQRAVNILRAGTTEDKTGQIRLAQALLTLSSLHYEGQDYDEAEAVLRQCHALYEASLGAESMEVSTCLNNLGRILEQKGFSGQGAKLHRQAVDIRQRLLGDHSETAFSLGNLGTALAGDAQWEAACAALQEAIACYQRLGMGAEDAAQTCRANLALCHTALAERTAPNTQK